MGLRYIGVLPRKAPRDILERAFHYAELLRRIGWTVHTHSVLIRDSPNAQPGKTLIKIEGCMFVLYWHNIWSMSEPEGHVAYAVQLAKYNEIPCFNIGSPKEQVELEHLIESLQQVYSPA